MNNSFHSKWNCAGSMGHSDTISTISRPSIFLQYSGTAVDLSNRGISLLKVYLGGGGVMAWSTKCIYGTCCQGLCAPERVSLLCILMLYPDLDIPGCIHVTFSEHVFDAHQLSWPMTPLYFPWHTNVLEQVTTNYMRNMVGSLFTTRAYINKNNSSTNGLPLKIDERFCYYSSVVDFQHETLK